MAAGRRHARHDQLDTPPFFAARRDGNFEVIVDSSNEFVDEPSIQLARFLSHDRSPLNISRYVDRTLDDLFDRQARATDAAERLRLIRDFETRLLTEAYTVPLFWGQRIIPLAAELRGFSITPSYYLGQDLASLWLRR
jgi:peptide/nickel transport system substrate-binding protein